MISKRTNDQTKTSTVKAGLNGQGRILEDLSAEQDYATMVANLQPQADDEIAKLRAELAKAKAENNRLKGISNQMKVSEKGALSVYGLGRFPVTLYKQQWFRLLAMSDEIKTFIENNKDKLTEKPAKEAKED